MDGYKMKLSGGDKRKSSSVRSNPKRTKVFGRVPETEPSCSVVKEPPSDISSSSGECDESESDETESSDPEDGRRVVVPRRPVILPADVGDTRAGRVYSQVVGERADVDEASRSCLFKVLTEKNPTDRAHYPDTIESDHIKMFIVRYGSCRPTGPFPQSQNNRSFSTYYYSVKSKSGLEASRHWLCYSPTLNSCYCEPCWLFADRADQNFNVNWVKGISDWKSLCRKIRKHESSPSHVDSCKVFNSWRCITDVDATLRPRPKKEPNFWRRVLHRFINVALTLSALKTSSSENNEHDNFLSLVNLLGQYDSVLKNLLNEPDCSIKYSSLTVQHELLQLMTLQIRNDLLADIRESNYFSVILNTDRDNAGVDQLSLIFRYASISKDERNRPADIQIREIFTGFTPIYDRSVSELTGNVLGILREKNIPVSKCRGVTYDGVNEMYESYRGLESKLFQLEPNARFVHYADHNLNFIINDSLSGISGVSEFFDVVERLYVFCSKNAKSWELLQKKPVNAETLDRLSPGYWTSKFDSLGALYSNYKEILRLLTDVILRSLSSNERKQAVYLKGEIENFEFILLIIVFTKIFTHLNTVSRMLQSNYCNLTQAEEFLRCVLCELKKLRNDYHKIKKEASFLSSTWGVVAEFSTKRSDAGRVHDDAGFVYPEMKFVKTVYNALIDTVAEQIEIRLTSFADTVSKFKVLVPKYLETATDRNLYDDAVVLQQRYSNDLTDNFGKQLLSFRTVMSKEIKKCSNVRTLAKIFLCDHQSTAVTYNDIHAAFMLFLTLPVTKATPEKPVAKVNTVKNFLKTSTGKNNDGSFAIIAIENEYTKAMNFGQIINLYTESNIYSGGASSKCSVNVRNSCSQCNIGNKVF